MTKADKLSKTENALQEEPHCVHVIGIGRTGAVYVEALLRTGEIEDNLTRDGTTFSSLLVDIGDDDIQIASDYARSFKPRLASRKLPLDRHHHEAVVLAVPDAATFSKRLDAVRPLYTKGGGEELIAKLPKGFESPKVGEHTPRAIAKAVGAFACYLDDMPLAGALRRFADQVKRASQKSTILIAFGAAGGTGSGMAFDIARELGKLGLGESVQIVGVAQLSHSGDGDYADSAAQSMTIADLEQNPFPGGCFVVSSEHSWQRLSSYTTTGLKEVRQHFKQLVTNRFVADSFMRWAVSDGSAHLLRVLNQSAGKLIMFNITKFSHPGVQVLPGQARSLWDAVLQQWISFVPKFAGLSEGFKADYAEAHVFTARYMPGDTIADDLKSLIVSTYLKKGKDNYRSFSGEFFDELTAYANVILPGVRKDDLTAYKPSKAKAGKSDSDVNALERA
jgi:hypothetical protein